MGAVKDYIISVQPPTFYRGYVLLPIAGIFLLYQLLHQRLFQPRLLRSFDTANEGQINTRCTPIALPYEYSIRSSFTCGTSGVQIVHAHHGSQHPRCRRRCDPLRY